MSKNSLSDLNHYTIKTLIDSSTQIEKSIRQTLLAHFLQSKTNRPINLSYLISHQNDRVEDRVVNDYQHGLQRLAAGEPLAYIIGKQGFWKHEFLVNEHTLIPRPDTEILVETAVNFIKQKSNYKPMILDLGTGSGCIAISIALEHPKPNVTAVDFSKQALAVAEQNAKRLGVTNIHFLQSDWFSQIPAQTFDIIVSNPPYIDPQDPHLSHLTHEPITALVSDKHGLSDIEHIIDKARNFLSLNGLLAIEHGYDQAKSVQAMFAQYGFSDITTVKDYGGNDRVTYGIFTDLK